MPGRHVERRQLRRDQSEREGAVVGEVCRGGDGVGVRGQQAHHLVATAQMRTADPRHPACDGLDVGAGTDRRHRQREASTTRPREVRPRRRDGRQPEPLREVGEYRIALVVVGQSLSGEFDDDVVASEPLDHSTESGLGSTDTRTIQRSPHRALATARQDHPVPGVAGQPVDVVAQQPLLTAGHVGVGDGP